MLQLVSTHGPSFRSRTVAVLATGLRHSSTTRGAAPTSFHFEPLFQEENPHAIKWKKVSSSGVQVVKGPDGLDFLKIESGAIRKLVKQSFYDINHFYREAHMKQVAKILVDPEASENDKFVALELMKNANISASGKLPSCQDTGTAIVKGYKGERVLTGGIDEESISRGVYDAYVHDNLRYSQVAPLSMFLEKNTGTNLPAQIELYAGRKGHELEYKFMTVAKGGGSANKTQLFQKTKALLREDPFEEFILERIRELGTAACPPYHLTIVVGGLSAEQNLATVKLASCKYYDSLPTSGNASGRAFRDIEWETRIMNKCFEMGIGAQFGGKYFVHDVRVVRLPRHGASCPVGLGVSCSADRQQFGKITPDGVFLEQLAEDPEKYMPSVAEDSLSSNVVSIDLSRPMDEILKTLSKYPVKTRVSLTGTLIVARDIAHSRLKDMITKGEPLPDYFTQFPVYYAGPAKKPKGMASGSFGPTTSGRMDPYVDEFQALGGSMVMIGKGNRSTEVTNACKKHGGFYLGSIGGVAAVLAKNSIKDVQVLDMAELGMEAVWKIEVEDFPAFIVVDDKGNDFFRPNGDDGAHSARYVEMDSSFDEMDVWFHELDKDDSGFISAKELAQGFGISVDEAHALLKEAARRHGQENLEGLDYDDFRSILFNHPELEDNLHHHKE